MNKSYEFSNEGLKKAINERHSHLKARRKILITVSIFALTSVLNLPSASVIAFRCL